MRRSVGCNAPIESRRAVQSYRPSIVSTPRRCAAIRASSLGKFCGEGHGALPEGTLDVCADSKPPSKLLLAPYFKDCIIAITSKANGPVSD